MAADGGHVKRLRINAPGALAMSASVRAQRDPIRGHRFRTRQKAIARLTSYRAVTMIAVGLLLAAAAPQTASALWTHVALSRSSTEPYYACRPQGGRPGCDLIEDPTPADDARGPVAAGTVTRGPEQQVSPQLYGNGVGGGYSPENLSDAYDLPSRSAGTGQTIAIVDAYDDPDAEPDLEKYRSEYRIRECTGASGCFRKVNQNGGTDPYPTANGEWAKEISLDLDMVSAICPNCHILLVEANENSESDLAAAENEAVELGATEISNSFGASTPSEPSADAAAYDHPGIPISAAGGDHGYGVESPASDPHVIAVGGTTLVPAPNVRGWTETAWSDSGSGCSREPKPAWQADPGCRYRTNNDVAAVADPNTPVSIYDSYEQAGSSWRLTGGTSVATPIVAAAMALANPYTRSFEGARSLYLEAAISGSGALDDVVSGSNGDCETYLCEALPGYDGPTGLGSLWGVPEVPPPTAATDQATAIEPTEAILNAAVNPSGADVDECRFEYGTTTSYGTSVPCTSLPGSGTSPQPVSGSAVGLIPSATYHFRIAIGYPGGADSGEDRTFTTSGLAPAASTEAASAITQTSATLNGKVDPNGNEVTECEFEYGTSNAYEASAPCALSPGSGDVPVAVSAPVTGLTSGATYHFRVRATSGSGTGYGGDRSFELVASAIAPGPIVEQAPVEVQSDPTVAPPTMGAEAPRPATSSEPQVVSAAELAGADLRVDKAGRMTVGVRCAAETMGCEGTITLRTLNAVRIVAAGERPVTRILTLASARFALAAERVAGVKLELSVAGRALLAHAHAHALRARAIILVDGAGGVQRATQAIVTIHLERARHS